MSENARKKKTKDIIPDNTIVDVCLNGFFTWDLFIINNWHFSNQLFITSGRVHEFGNIFS